MDLAALLLGGAGAILSLRYAEDAFAGTAEEGARRVRMRRIGHILTLGGFALLSWVHFTGP